MTLRMVFLDSFRFDDIDPTTEETIEEQGWAIDMGLLNPPAAPAMDDGNLPSMTLLLNTGNGKCMCNKGI